MEEKPFDTIKWKLIMMDGVHRFGPLGDLIRIVESDRDGLGRKELSTKHKEVLKQLVLIALDRDMSVEDYLKDQGYDVETSCRLDKMARRLQAKERAKEREQAKGRERQQKKALELERVKERERQAREFERQKVYKEIWDKNWGKCELCGIRTKSIKDAYFEFLTDKGRLVFGTLPNKYLVLLCQGCRRKCESVGVLELEENEFWDYHTKAKVNENIELYKHKTDFRDSSHPRYILPEVKQEVWSRDKGRCQMCGSREELQYDHIIPISKGGSNTERNIQLLCKDCNQEKLDKIV